MTILINIDGATGTPEEMTVSVLDRGFLYGDSAYEVVRTYEGVVFALPEHMQRLERSASRLAIELPDREWLAAQIMRTVAAAGNPETYCRIIVTRGIGPMTLDPTTAATSCTVIIAKPYEPFPEKTFEDGIAVAIPVIRRTSRAALDPAIKSGNYLNSVLALGEARRGGFEDALMLDQQGLVTEATSSNVFTFCDGELRTPALELGLLVGVTRGMVIDLAREHGIACRETEITLDELVKSDEVMLTSTLREVQPIVRIDEALIGDGTPGPMAARLRTILHEYALSRVRG